MPLIEGKSDKSFGKNVKTEMKAGKPMKQSLAIAYHMKKKAKKMASGGKMCAEGCDMDHAHMYAEGDVVDESPAPNPDPSPSPAAESEDSPPMTKAQRAAKAFKGESSFGGWNNYADGGDINGSSTPGVNEPLTYQESKKDERKGQSLAGQSVRRANTSSSPMAKRGGYETAKNEARNVLAEQRSMSGQNRKNLADGGDVAMEESDRMLNQHGADESGPMSVAEDNEPQHERMVSHPVENQQHVDENLVGQIMKKRQMHFSRGGQVANDVGMGASADLEDNQFDDLVKRDDDMEDADYTGANSGDQIGNAGEDGRRMDMIEQIMRSRRKKDRLPESSVINMLDDLKEFEKFLKICRKQGVSEVTFAGTSVKLGDLPTKATEDDGAEVTEDILTTNLTPEQLMFLAVDGGQ